MDILSALMGQSSQADDGLQQVLEPAGQLSVDNITSKEVEKASQILKKYKEGKTNLEKRIIENEQWYKMRHWEYMRKKYNSNRIQSDRMEPASAWLFNSITNKHADAMDNFPEPNVLPREKGDEKDAKSLSSILPVVLEHNRFEDVYSDNWWYKLKMGTAAYGIFWDTGAENGLGDIAVKKLDMLNLFWEPGITDIQNSRNLFIVDLVDKDVLKEQYPDKLKSDTATKTIDVKEYVYDDTVDNTEKSVVVDWYYKKRDGSKNILHFVKFVGNTVLYASENDPEYVQKGWYDHGKYPVVFDKLYPEEGTPYGFGYVDICKDPQTYIDKLNQIVAENALRAGKARYLYKENNGVNPKDFADLSKDLIPANGDLDDNFKLIQENQLDGNILNFLTMKIDELKETSGNRDVNQGSASGVTAAAAIAALQEAGNKLSRDMLKASYRSYQEINYFVIELIRQFYTVQRTFRIDGESGFQYEDYSNTGIIPQPVGQMASGESAYRVPIFDIKIKPQKSNPFSRMANNELMKELYGMGFFGPDMADQALIALSQMDFEGKDALVEKIDRSKTLLEMCKQLSMQLMQANMQLYTVSGGQMGSMPDPEQWMQMQAMGAGSGATTVGSDRPTGSMDGGRSAASANRMSGIDGANRNASTPYGERLAERAKVNINDGGGV